MEKTSVTSMEKPKVSLDIAREEVTKWLDYKKVGAKKREEYKDNIDALVDGIYEGILTLTPDMLFVHNLKFPIGEGESIKELRYKPRIKQLDIANMMKGIKAGDTSAQVRAYVCAVTGQPANIIAQLDTEDFSVSQSIGVFFIG